MAFSSAAKAQAVITETLTAGEDTSILNAGGSTDLWVRDTNIGSEAVLPVGDMLGFGGNLSDGMIYFELNRIPTEATIVEATLSLYVSDYTGSGSNVAVWLITKPWTEGQVTWNLWQTNLTPAWENWEPITPVPLASINSSDIGSRVNLTITHMVQAVVQGDYENHGFRIWLLNNNREALFGSSENVTVSHRPTLYLEYDPLGILSSTTHPLSIHILNLGLPVDISLGVIGLVVFLAPLLAASLSGVRDNQTLLSIALVSLSASTFLRFWPPITIIFIGLLVGWMGVTTITGGGPWSLSRTSLAT